MSNKTKTRRRASATSPVVVTDNPDGSREFVADAKTAATLTITPEPVVETKAPKYPALLGRFAPGVHKLNEGEPGKYRTVMGRFEEGAAKPSSDMHGEFATIRGRFGPRVGGPVKIEDVAAVGRRKRRRISDTIMKRIAKSAVSDEQKTALVDGLTDPNAISIHTSVRLVEALLDDGDSDVDCAEVHELMKAVTVTQQGLTKLLTMRESATELPELLEAVSAYKAAAERVIEGLLEERTARDVTPVEVVAVKDAPISLSKAEIEAIVDRVVSSGKAAVRQESKMARPLPSFEAAEYAIRRAAEQSQSTSATRRRVH